MRLLQMVLCLLVAAGVGSRATAAQVMTMGLKGGVSIADASVEVDGSTVNTDGRTSFDVGGFLGMVEEEDEEERKRKKLERETAGLDDADREDDDEQAY